MSEHSHDAHGHAGHDRHDGHDAHGSHDSHDNGHGGHGGDGGDGGDGHGHEERWGDYNSEPLATSNLPAVGPSLLIAFGTALTFLLCMIVAASFMLASSREASVPTERRTENGK